MAYIQYNPNPKGVLVGDCVIRAISKLTEKDWDSVYGEGNSLPLYFLVKGDFQNGSN